MLAGHVNLGGQGVNSILPGGPNTKTDCDSSFVKSRLARALLQWRPMRALILSCTLILLVAMKPEAEKEPLVSSQSSHSIHPGPGLDTLVRGLQSPRPASCQFELTLMAAMPDSRQEPDRRGEWVSLRNETKGTLDLTHFVLASGRRRLPLDGLHIGPLETIRIGYLGLRSLGSLQLRNRKGCIRLINPCEREISALGWLKAHEGVAVERPHEPKKQNPRPTEVDEGFGGCGQT